jgi:hypothetical protein
MTISSAESPEGSANKRAFAGRVRYFARKGVIERFFEYLQLLHGKHLQAGGMRSFEIVPLEKASKVISPRTTNSYPVRQRNPRIARI